MENFAERRLEFISKLEKVQEVFREIRARDKNRLVIQYGERSTLDKLARKNEKMLNKLRNCEFNVAVVGLEKAGKSTLANALLNLVILPEYTERCTYTTTEIRAGNSDAAEVFFYGKEKFEQNFHQMLEDVGYPEAVTFEELRLGDFERYWRNVKSSNPALFQQYNGTTVEDIKTMLGAKDVIEYLLGRECEVLNVNDAADYQKLYRYITGIEDFNDGHLERTAEPYAVEKVIIKSTGLADMKNIILYDVPGFDSPTELHKKQTEEMLRMSDAIILVTNVGDRPNLTGTQLDMLHRVRDDDGIRLSDKVFVFGNKLDMAGNQQLAKDNAAALVHDAADSYSIAQRNRIVCGSAKAYLERHGKFSQDDRNRGIRNISVTLEGWGISDGIDELREKLQDYYNNARLDVLKMRAERTTAEIKNFLAEILSRYDSESETVDTGEEYFMQAKDALEDFSKKAGAIEREYRDRVNSEAEFTALIRDSLTEIFPNATADSFYVNNAENTGAASEGYALSRVDALSREQLYLTFKKNIVMKTASSALAVEEEIYQRLAVELLKSLGAEEGASNIKDLEAGARELFQSLLIENGEHCYFNPLIERYMTGLIEVLIRSPYASAERLTQLTSPESMADFQALAVYCGQDDTAENQQRYFFAKILTHDDITPPDADDNETVLRNFFDEYNANLAAGFDYDRLPFKQWGAILAKIGIKVSESDLLERLKKALINFVGIKAWAQMSPRAKNAQLNNAIIEYCVSDEPVPLADYVKTLGSQIRAVETKDEMLAVLNEDIQILREFTLKSAVKAVGLERAFSSIMAKNIDIIRESIDTAAGKQTFNQWLRENLRKIRESDYAIVDRNIEAFRDKKSVADSIRPLLSKLDE